MRISDWSSDVCSSDLPPVTRLRIVRVCARLLASISADNFEGCAVSHVGGDSEDVLAVSLDDFWKDRHDFASLGPRDAIRSEERRLGKECVSTCRSRWSPND